jgi:excisionase family DNA binding protein
MSAERALGWSREAYQEFAGWVRTLPERKVGETVPQGTVVEVQPALLSVEEAARYLSIGRSEIFKMLREGRIRSIKRGRRRLVPKSELDKFIREEVAKGQEK